MAKNATRGAARRDLARQSQNFSEDEAEQFFAEIRFGSTDRQICPACGAFSKHYRLAHRRQWRCRHIECGHTFSVTSGTRLDNRKLSFRQLLRLLIHLEAAPKGATLVAVSNAACLVEKCAFQNLMKVREAILDNADTTLLQGIIHMDGAWVCGKLRRSNRRVRQAASDVLRIHGAAQIRHRLRAINPLSKANLRRAQNKRVVIAMVQVDPVARGPQRVIVAVCRSENAHDVLLLARRHIAVGSTVFTDENPAYNGLAAIYEHHAVNHSEEYSTPEGVSDNMAESFFSRLRRGEYGVHHGFRSIHMAFYAGESAWRETHRRHSQREKVTQLASWLLMPGYSHRWRGYHGGHRRHRRRHARPEILVDSLGMPCVDARRLAGKAHSEEVAAGAPAAPAHKA